MTPRERHVLVGRIAPGAADREYHLRARFTGDELAGVGDRDPLGGLVADLHDELGRDDPGLVGRRLRHRVIDLEELRGRVDGQKDADTAETPLAVGLELLELVGVEVLGVRVEFVQPAVDHALDEILPLLIGQLAVEVRVHLGHHVHDLADALVVPVRRRGAVADRQPQSDQRGHHQEPDQVPKWHVYPHRRAGGVSPLLVAHQELRFRTLPRPTRSSADSPTPTDSFCTRGAARRRPQDRHRRSAEHPAPQRQPEPGRRSRPGAPPRRQSPRAATSRSTTAGISQPVSP